MKFPFESLAVIHKVCTFASAFEGQALVERKGRRAARSPRRLAWGCSVAGAALKVKF